MKRRRRGQIIRLTFSAGTPQRLRDFVIEQTGTQPHDAIVVDGPDGFIQFISEMQKKHPKLKVAISKALADDDLVVLHVHLTREPNDPGLAIAELFRLKDGKIIEHWDVVQPVPEKTASGNSMF